MDKELISKIQKIAKRESAAAAKAKKSTALKLYELYRDSLLLAAPYDFDSYLLYVEWNREPQKKFYAPRRRVLRPLVADLQDLADGKIDFLGISLPPRVGKSTLCIFFMTWIMGRNPDCANLMSGHSDKLTSGFYDEILSIITDPTYLWADVFPGTAIAAQSAKNYTIDLNRKKRFSTMTCRSVSGTLTGAVEVGEDGILYCDDLVEDLEEALSAERMQKKYDAYLNQLKDRKKDGARELMVGTRWNVFDPLGRIQAQYEGNPRYRFTVIPALNPITDESNFIYDFGLGFSTEYYHDMRESIDRATWYAKYLGSPYIREGILYPEEELRRYFELPDTDPDAVVGICDTASNGKDYTFLPVAYQYGQDYYIDDCVLTSADPKISEPACAELLLKRKVQQCQFESNSAGGKIAEKVQALVKEHGGITHITTKYTTSNKETKIIVNSSFVKEHFLFRAQSTYSRGSTYGQMMRFLTEYTMSGKNKFDDVPDGLAQLALYVQTLGGNTVKIIQRPF